MAGGARTAERPGAQSDTRLAVDVATAEAAERLRCKALASLSCKDAERLLDSNFHTNDEVWAALRVAWDCAVRLDCQLGEAHRPEEQRGRWMQALSLQRTALESDRRALETELLCAKLEVQTALACSGGIGAERLGAVLQSNLQFRGRCHEFGEQLEAVVTSTRSALQKLGERPDMRAFYDVVAMAPSSSSQAGGTTRRWYSEFDSAEQENETILRALRRPGAAASVPACAVEEVIDHNWRFALELVGLFEKLVERFQPEPAGDVPAAGAEPGSPPSGAGTAPAALPDGGEVAEGAERLRAELEGRLSALLECKLNVQAAAARGSEQDTAAIEATIEASRSTMCAARELLIANAVDISDIVPTKFAAEMLPHPAAFGLAAVRRAADEEGPEVEEQCFPPVLRVLTYNIFVRAPAPQFAHNTGNDRKDERLARFAEHLESYDLICLQEMFGAFSNRRDWLAEVALRLGFRHECRCSTNVRPRFLVDAGLMIMSRLPIVTSASLTYSVGVHIDRLCAKGALYARLQCGQDGPYLHVCTTHLQSSYSEASFEQSRLVRHKQLQQLVGFLAEAADDRESEGGSSPSSPSRPPAGRSRRRWPLLLCGTLNFNGRSGPHDGSSSAEYRAVREELRSSLGEVRDLLYDTQGSHPVTYADTRIAAAGEVPAERVLTNAEVYESDTLRRQCLDYMFFFPQQAWPPEGLGVDDAGGGALSTAPAKASPGELQEALAPATCQIQKFLVDRARDVGAPVTQLSDHYGVEATLSVIPAIGPAPPPPWRKPAPAPSLQPHVEVEPPAEALAAADGAAAQGDGAPDDGEGGADSSADVACERGAWEAGGAEAGGACDASALPALAEAAAGLREATAALLDGAGGGWGHEASVWQAAEALAAWPVDGGDDEVAAPRSPAGAASAEDADAMPGEAPRGLGSSGSDDAAADAREEDDRGIDPTCAGLDPTPPAEGPRLAAGARGEPT